MARFEENDYLIGFQIVVIFWKKDCLEISQKVKLLFGAFPWPLPFLPCPRYFSHCLPPCKSVFHEFWAKKVCNNRCLQKRVCLADELPDHSPGKVCAKAAAEPYGGPPLSAFFKNSLNAGPELLYCAGNLVRPPDEQHVGVPLRV
jgi:hypothetical protein